MLALAGLRCTPQRTAVLKYLLSHPRHATAEEIHRAVLRTHPGLAQGTTYKALHALAEAGLVHEMRLLGDPVRYEANTTPHHHFVCDVCGVPEDIPPGTELLSGLPPTLARHTVRAYEMILRGVCPACRRK